MDILIGILQIVLVLVSLFLILVVLMQPGSANGGMGAAMGGGAAESALGAESSSVLSRLTTKVAITFFVLVLGLNLLILGIYGGKGKESENTLPEFAVPAEMQGADEAAIDDLLEKATSAVEGEKEEAAEAATSLIDQAKAAAEESAEEGAKQLEDSLPVAK